MLGCQDFCGYYDWTFKYVRERFGQDAVHRLWSESIGLDSQKHYLAAAQSDGLRGLLRTWIKTGEEEHCDWTFTLDESRNVLRWDMRQCPSKGFLLNNDLHADEDYCDHCMGWIIPGLESAEIEIAVHEHNHCGQCWGELRVKGKPYQSLSGHAAEVTRDPRWEKGHLDRWQDGVQQAVALTDGAETDSVKAIKDWIARRCAVKQTSQPTLISDASYLAETNSEPDAVLIADRIGHETLGQLGRRYKDTQADKRPLLLFTYFPAALDEHSPRFVAYGLPRPVPVLPLLIRARLYRHRPGTTRPSTEEMLGMVRQALEMS